MENFAVNFDNMEMVKIHNFFLPKEEKARSTKSINRAKIMNQNKVLLNSSDPQPVVILDKDKSLLIFLS